ncbi:MAG: hypothetical protein WCE94_15735 [Candidatus Methanoperedens sp.]
MLSKVIFIAHQTSKSHHLDYWRLCQDRLDKVSLKRADSKAGKQVSTHTQPCGYCKEPFKVWHFRYHWAKINYCSPECFDAQQKVFVKARTLAKLAKKQERNSEEPKPNAIAQIKKVVDLKAKDKNEKEKAILDN